MNSTDAGETSSKSIQHAMDWNFEKSKEAYNKAKKIIRTRRYEMMDSYDKKQYDTLIAEQNRYLSNIKGLRVKLHPKLAFNR